MEPVLLGKLHNIKLSCSVFRVTTFQFNSKKVALSILFQYTHNFNENLQTLYSKSVTNNVFDSKSQNQRQCILSYLALLILSYDELVDCKVEIMQLTIQVDNIFATLYITCLQFSYSIKLHFPYDIISLPNGCKASPISFVLPSNTNINVEAIIETPEYKLGFNRSYSKINNFS